MNTDAVAAEIRKLPLMAAEDVVTLINALAGRVVRTDFLGSKKLQDGIVEELDHLSDWITDEAEESAKWQEAA